MNHYKNQCYVYIRWLKNLPAALFLVLFGALVVAVAAATTAGAAVVAGGGQVFGLFVVLLVPASLFLGAPFLLFPVVLVVLRLVLELQPLLGVDEPAVAEVILPVVVLLLSVLTDLVDDDLCY